MYSFHVDHVDFSHFKVARLVWPRCTDAVVILWIHRIRRHQRLSNAGLRTKVAQGNALIKCNPLARLPTRVSTISIISAPFLLCPHGFTAVFTWIRTAGTYPLYWNGWCLTTAGCWLVTQESAPNVFKSLLSHWNKMKQEVVFVAKLWSSTIAKRDALSIVECTIRHHPTRTAGSHCFPAGPCGPCVDKNPLHRPVLGTRKRRFLIGSPTVWGNYPAPCDATRCCRADGIWWDNPMQQPLAQWSEGTKNHASDAK